MTYLAGNPLTERQQEADAGPHTGVGSNSLRAAAEAAQAAYAASKGAGNSRLATERLWREWVLAKAQYAAGAV